MNDEQYDKRMEEIMVALGKIDLNEIDLEMDDANDLFDEFCDPKQPKSIYFHDISAAAIRCRSHIVRTPCKKSHLGSMLGLDLYLKKENLQYTGSFKERGARNALLLLSKKEKENGIIAASAGNHAQALCYHAKQLNIPVVVIMPTMAPIMKIQLCRSHGAIVLVKGKNLESSRRIALKLRKYVQLRYLNGYDHPHILQGQGTVGLEMLDQVENLDAVIVPIGGAGLIAGISLAIKQVRPEVQVIGVESVRCASYMKALENDGPVYCPSESSLADGLAVSVVGYNAFATAKQYVDKVVVVEEEFIALAVLRLMEVEKTVVEGAGAAGVAALLQNLLPELKGKNVVIPLCGGNIDTTVLGRVIERGLAEDGRLVRFHVIISDRPGSLEELTHRMTEVGISVKDMYHERAWLKSDIHSVQVKCVVETTGRSHADELRHVLQQHYSTLIWS